MRGLCVNLAFLEHVPIESEAKETLLSRLISLTSTLRHHLTIRRMASSQELRRAQRDVIDALGDFAQQVTPWSDIALDCRCIIEEITRGITLEDRLLSMWTEREGVGFITESAAPNSDTSVARHIADLWREERVNSGTDPAQLERHVTRFIGRCKKMPFIKRVFTRFYTTRSDALNQLQTAVRDTGIELQTQLSLLEQDPAFRERCLSAWLERPYSKYDDDVTVVKRIMLSLENR